LDEAVKTINIFGNEFSPDGANLRIDKNDGLVHQLGLNWKFEKQNPNEFITPAVDQAPVFYTWKDGLGGFLNTATESPDLIPNRYDDNTGGTPLPNGTVASDEWTIQKLWWIGDSDNIALHFGTNVYKSKNEAFKNIHEEYEFNPAADGALFRCWLIIRGGATDLSDPNDAVFVTPDRFGVAIEETSEIFRLNRVSLEKSADQTIPAGGWTSITFDTELFDVGAMHDGVNPTRVTFTTDGVYTIQPMIRWDGSGNTSFSGRILKNGATDLYKFFGHTTTGGEELTIGTSRQFEFNRGDYIELQGMHSFGAGIDVLSDDTFLVVKQDI
jgi:hypothetical protein